MPAASGHDHSSSDEENQAPLMALNQTTGLPDISQHAKDAAWHKGIVMQLVYMVLPRAIAAGWVTLIWFFSDLFHPGSATACSRMSALNLVHGFKGGELGYLYIAAGIYAVLVQMLNNIPTLYKTQVMTGDAGNLRANMQIFTVNTQPGHPLHGQLPHVVLVEDGDIGHYNRANRGLFHFIETTPANVLLIVLAGIVYPFPTFIVVCIFAIARVWYQIAYATGGYGSGLCKHAVPFVVANMLAFPIIEMMVWMIGCLMLHGTCS